MSNSIVKYNYKALRGIYNVYLGMVSDTRLQATVIYTRQIDNIFSLIERYPITWEYYLRRGFKFSKEFEDLVVFKSSDYINKLADR